MFRKMGKALSILAEYCPESITKRITDGYFRKRKSDDLDEDDLRLLKNYNSPKRRKLACTVHYIYQTLYVEGKDSDITVNILNKDWKLHKIYLGQSQYFKSMFSGSWNETSKSYISIEVGDPNITTDALDAVFGSFYQDEILLEPRHIVGILAASTMFQLDGLIEQCCGIMLDSISPLTVVQYFQASCRYGVQAVKESVLQWFEVNLLDYYQKNINRIANIDPELMLAIMKRPDLRVIQTEMSLYLLLKKWMYLRMSQPFNVALDISSECDQFFRNREDDTALLDTEKGGEYRDVFNELRLHHLALHLSDISVVELDNIIPEHWMRPVYHNHWVSFLKVYSRNDKGPSGVSDEEFTRHAIRCGRILNAGDSRSWRWNWFNYGIDLVWSSVDNFIFIKRQSNGMEHMDGHGSTPHSFMAQVEVFNLDENRQIKKHQKSAITTFPLSRYQDALLLTIDEEYEFPLYICVKILVTSLS